MLASRIAEVADGVISLRQTLERRPHIYSLTIYDLGSADYDLVLPLSIVVEEYGPGEGALARCPELEIFGDGVTAADAIGEVKSAMLDLYDELVATDPTTLGDLPLAWLRLLKKVVKTAA